MGRILPAFDYPPLKDGYWLPVTSTINWCEEDYYATIYSAEIVNTLTNLLFVYLGVKGIVNCHRYGHDRIFLISFAGYLLVGTGSFLFHCTLKYPMQLVDELSMIYTTCIMCYATFSYRRSPVFSQILALALAGLAAFITFYYHYIKDPSFHQNAYALLTAVVLFRSMYVMEVNLRPSLRGKYGYVDTSGKTSEQVSSERKLNAARDKETLRQMWWMIGMGLSIFLGGFAIWNLDNEYCGTLRRWRKDIGLPWGLLLEGHGWWHLMTGTGAYFYLVWGVWLRHCLNDRQGDYDLHWPSKFYTLPEIVPAKKVASGKSNGSTNGHINARSKKEL